MFHEPKTTYLHQGSLVTVLHEDGTPWFDGVLGFEAPATPGFYFVTGSALLIRKDLIVPRFVWRVDRPVHQAVTDWDLNVRTEQ